MNPQLHYEPDALISPMQAAIAATSASIVLLDTITDNSGKVKDLVLRFANPSFFQLFNENKIHLEETQSGTLPDIFKRREMCIHFNRVLQENARQTISVQYQIKERSLVLRVTTEPVDGQLVVTIIDVTSLSHAREMLEVQTTLMEENARSLEAVRTALEAEIERRGRLEGKLRRLAGTDHLSGLANRRSFLDRATAEFRRSRRYQHPLSLVMLDLDRFKTINDNYGHAAGDCVIVAVSQICQSLSRDGVDVVGRLGGEEFAVLLPETDLKGAGNFAERLRLMIENSPIFCDVKKLKITASFGVAALNLQDRDFSILLKRADKALYVSKETGRNMVSSQNS